MGQPQEMLARALEAVNRIGHKVIKSSEISRTYRERLIRNGYAEEIMSGWLVITDPSLAKGSSITWQSSYWEFLSRYLDARFQDNYILSGDSSLNVQLNSSIPAQITVLTTNNINQIVTLNAKHSLLVRHVNSLGSSDDHAQFNGVRVMSISMAITEVPPSYFVSFPVDAEIALKMVRHPSEVLKVLLEDGKSYIAARLAGAYRFIGLPEYADNILQTMRAGGWTLNESNPFSTAAPVIRNSRIASPYAERIKFQWQRWREDVLKFKPIINSQLDLNETIHAIDDVYQHDAYNSLSIEGYQVTEDLIAKIRSGEYDFNRNDQDRSQRDAMAAKGYLEAFNQVKQAVADIINGEDESKVISGRRHSWLVALFSAAIQAGIIKPVSLAGFRTHPVYIRNSDHVPPQRDYLSDCMEALDECMRTEPDNFVRGVLGHFFLVYIHPYSDGNGRTARFMMNCVFASSGLKWTVISVGNRDKYFKALEQASVGGNISAFAEFVSVEMQVVRSQP